MKTDFSVVILVKIESIAHCCRVLWLDCWCTFKISMTMVGFMVDLMFEVMVSLNVLLRVLML